MAHVCFGSQADICSAQSDVCFVPLADIRNAKFLLRFETSRGDYLAIIIKLLF
jgi:hypothetical protein